MNKFDPKSVRLVFKEQEIDPTEVYLMTGERFGEPPAPDNPDFEELHTEEQANEVERRFEAGFTLRQFNDYQARRMLIQAQDDAIRRQELKRLEKQHAPLTATIGRTVKAHRKAGTK